MGCGASSKYWSSQLSDSDASDDSDDEDDQDSTYGKPKKPRQEGRWLWEDSPDVWQAFERPVNDKLLDALQLGETEILLTLPNGDAYEVCMKTNMMKHLETRTQIRIKFKPARSSGTGGDAPEGPGRAPRSPPKKAKEKPTYYGGEWQWQAGPGSWKRFNSEIQNILQIAKTYKKYKVVFGLKGTIYEVNFEDLVQKNLSTGYQRRVRWHPAKQFQWALKTNIWIDYEEEENDTLVIALAEGRKSVRYRTRGSEYEVDFGEMIQVNISTNSARSRKVRLKGSDDHDSGPPPDTMNNADACYFPPKDEPSSAQAWPPKHSPGASPPGGAPDRGRHEPTPSRPPFASFFTGRKGAEAADAARKAADEGPREKRWGLGGRAVPKAGVPAPKAAPKAARAPKAPKAAKMPGQSSWKPPPRAEKKPEPGPSPGPGPNPGHRPGPGGRAGARPGGKADAKPSKEPPTGLKLPSGLNLPESAKAKKAATQMFSEFQELKTQPISDRKKAYRNACLKWHPDKNPDDDETATEVFQFLQDLKDWLLDD
eukprot:TRINITY_DN27350_c0_g1_i1.p1 TRINITY_DN27350_c0_g1~~TRINITY_DN27350_c0_g1_i1.p1  ORF type:complete len:539 (+),score=87.92 TRINITY_DN27350_c0_g1_i1:57-1673(+)